jgi:ubiquinone/menaquinone biosynthesis C-methylase UbiE
LHTNEKTSAPVLANLLTSFLKVFFYLLYHQFAWAYDYVAAIVSFGLWNQWVASVLPHLPGDTILELGHGPGHLQEILLELGKAAYAIDESQQMNRMAMHTLRSQHLQPLITNGYAQHLPFVNQRFEHVVATFPTEYIFLPDTLTEIKRVMTPGGSLVLLLVAVFTGSTLPVKAMRLLHRLTGQAPARLDPQTVEQIVRPIKLAGFQINAHAVPVRSSLVLVIVARLSES